MTKIQEINANKKASYRMYRYEREAQCLAALERWGKATAYRVARSVGISPTYATTILWALVDQGRVVATPVPHRPNVTKWMFEVVR